MGGYSSPDFSGFDWLSSNVGRKGWLQKVPKYGSFWVITWRSGECYEPEATAKNGHLGDFPNGSVGDTVV
jgi:hypothetical protein